MAVRASRSQRGAVLLLLLFMLVGLLLQLRPAIPPPHPDHTTLMALQQARQALLSYALGYADRKPGRYGVLPCPDMNASGFLQEGIAHGGCGGRHVNSLGHLPWKTLGLEPLQDGYGECLWYAVTGAYKANPAADRLNHDTADGFAVYTGADQAARPAAAVIIAPGAALPNQDRSTITGAELCGGHYDPSDYIEAVAGGRLSGRAFAVDVLMDAVPDSNQRVNDRVLWLSTRDIFATVARRTDFKGRLMQADVSGSLLRRVATCLSAYANSHSNPHNLSLPWPAALVHSTGSDYDDISSSAAVAFGHVPDRVDDSNAILGEVSGRRLISDCVAFAEPDTGAAWLWKNWRDHLYYAVAAPYQPRAILQDSRVCGTQCIEFGTTSHAAMLWFAGAALQDQDRSGGLPEAYLEGRLPGYPNGTDLHYSPAVGSNDTVYCLAGTPLVPRPCT